jgi:four helix bundle protein
MNARSFEELQVWQKSHALVLKVYHMTAKFPREELFGLSSQLRRAAVSVPANIAEGFVKRGKADKLRFYNIAQGSLEEVRYYLRLANDLRYFDTASESQQLSEISRMLESYISTINASRIRNWSILFTTIALPLLTSGFWLLTSGFSFR